MQINAYSINSPRHLSQQQPYKPSFGSSAVWQSPGLLARTLPKVALACVAVLPVNPVVQAAIHLDTDTTLSALSSTDNIPGNMASLIAVVGLLSILLGYRRASLGHELGHVISGYQTAGNSGFDQLEGTTSYPVLRSRFLQYTNHYSQAWINHGIRLEQECERAKADGILFTDAFNTKREQLISMLREVNVIAEAGHLLEGYISGYEMPTNGLSDRILVYRNIPQIATLIKPKAEWGLIEFSKFVLSEKKRAEEDAKTLLTGYERSKVQAVYGKLLEQAKQGKTSWTRAELDYLLEMLD